MLQKKYGGLLGAKCSALLDELRANDTVDSMSEAGAVHVQAAPSARVSVNDFPPFTEANAMKWVTRERPKIDRVACPWLIARFIDEDPEFLFVPATEVLRVASETGATPYDVEGVELTHVGPLCSFDALLSKYQLEGDEALAACATIVRGADTDRLDLAPQCAGPLAISLGLSRLYGDDHEQLRHGFVVYDALYAWLTGARDETHSWNPQRSGSKARV